MRQVRFGKIFLAAAVLFWCLTSAVHWGTALTLSVFMVLAGVWSVVHARCRKQSEILDAAPFHGFGMLGWMLLGMMGMTVFSMIPLPLSILDVLSPSSAALYREDWNLAGIERGWGFLTASFGDTAFALWGLVGAFGCYLFLLRYGAKHDHVKYVAHVLGAAGLLIVAMLGLKHIGHPLFIGETGARAVFHLGLPINENHLSGILAMLSLLALGSAFSHRHHHASGRRLFWLMLYVAFGACLVLLRSRGALLGWGVGHVVLGVLAFGRTRQLSVKTGAVCLAGFALILGCVLYLSSATIGAIHQEVSDIEWTNPGEDGGTTQSGQISKTWMYADFPAMAADWGRMGTGRSAFGDVYPAYQGFTFGKYFRHAENEFWEILLEYGWFWGSLWLIFGAAGLVLLFRMCWREKNEMGAVSALLAGVCAVLVQNFFDFGLRDWTVGLPFWIACGVLEARRNRWKYGRIENDKGEMNRRLRIQAIAGYSLWGIALAAAIAASGYAIDGMTERGVTEMRQAFAKGGLNQPEVASAVQNNMVVRAASAKVRRIAALELVRLGALSADSMDRQAYWSLARKWYESAYQRAPRDAMNSVYLAKICLALGDEDCAAQHWIRAIENSPRLTSLAMNEMSALSQDKIIIPASQLARQALIEALLKSGRYEDVIKISDRVWDEDRVQSVSFRCQMYRVMGLDEACDLELEQLSGEPDSLVLYGLKLESMVRNHQCESMFAYMKSSEKALSEFPEYWEKRLHYSVYYGKCMGDAWYRSEIQPLLLRSRQLASGSVKKQYAMYVDDAKYALEIEQYSRAVRSAENALTYRPGSREATLIRDEASRLLEQRKRGEARKP